MTTDVDAPHVRAHQHSSRHRAELTASEWCGCFHCLAIYPPGDIQAWIDEGDGTALCPRCGIDSVLGDASGFPIEAGFLRRMQQHWF